MIYNNSPIREAIFDIRIDKLGVTDIDKLEKIHRFIKKSYPIKQKQIKYAGKIEIVKEQINTPFNSSIHGFIFKSKDEKRQVQIRLDGFTFNFVGQYSEWKEFSSEALNLLQIYFKELKPNKVTRIALRFINRIEIPLPVGKFQNYIINIPPIPKSLPQSFSNFFMRIEVPCDNEGTNIILSETIEQPTKDYLPFILDIDVYKIGKIEMDIKTLKEEFSKLRNLKNSTFESCITDEARNLFN